MMMLRFKLLAAGVLVATGLGLSVGGGWSGEAAAQVAGTPGTKPVPPKGDVAVAQLKAELEKVKAMLARAEAEAANDAANQNRLETYRRLMNDARNVELPTKFEYEPVPKEGLTDFEERLARREKAGWEFVGQVTIKGFGPEEKLVFRKLPTPPKATGFNPVVAPPGGMLPPKATEGPLAPTPPVGPGGPSGLMPPKAMDPTEKVAPLNRGPGLPVEPMLPGSLPPHGFGPAPDALKLVEPIARRAPGQSYLERIAHLEKLLAEYQAGKEPVKSSLGKCYYRSEDFGNWQLPQLIDVLDKVFADEIKAKTFNATFRIESEKGTFTVNDATPDEIRAVTAWLKKLKK